VVKWSIAILVFATAVIGGRYYSRHHFHGGVTTPRVPAAIPKVFDYTHLEGEALETAVQRRLLSGTEFTKADEGIELHVGHFVTNDGEGHPAFACDVYNRVTFIFEAEGFATGGERPTLTVEGPCEMGENVSEMKALLVPVEKVLSEKPGNLELSYAEAGAVSMKFTNMSEDWPRQWVLSGIKIFNRDDGRSIILDQKSMRKLSSNPLTMIW
jgi:hypothetical protein